VSKVDFDDLEIYGEQVLALVVSDFGRDAALRFCHRLAEIERERIIAALPPGSTFYDEYRRLSLSLIGDLAFIKEGTLSRYKHDGRPLDDGVLVGFPGGPSVESVTPRIGLLALEAMAGPIRRGLRRVLVLLPCNTLAPVSWELARRFQTEESPLELLADAIDGEIDSALVQAARSLNDVAVKFPTVPEAVLAVARDKGAKAVAPWGTERIVEVYEEAAMRTGEVRVIGPTENEQNTVLHAIRAAISGDPSERKSAQAALIGLAERLRSRDAGGILAVEACTDLDYGVGLDSNDAYATALVDAVYGSSCS